MCCTQEVAANLARIGPAARCSAYRLSPALSWSRVEQPDSVLGEKLRPLLDRPRIVLPRTRCRSPAGRKQSQPPVDHHCQTRRGRAVLEEQVVVDQHRHPFPNHGAMPDIPGFPALRREVAQGNGWMSISIPALAQYFCQRGRRVVSPTRTPLSRGEVAGCRALVRPAMSVDQFCQNESPSGPAQPLAGIYAS